MSDTPRVDEAAFLSMSGLKCVHEEFAQQLERELAAKTKEYDELKSGMPQRPTRLICDVCQLEMSTAIAMSFDMFERGEL